MTEQEINIYIHEKILNRGCVLLTTSPNWTEFDDEGICKNCGVAIESHNVLDDYCSAFEPRSLLDEVVEAVTDIVGRMKYIQSLWAWSDAGIMSLTYLQQYKLATASTKQIARACVEAHKERVVSTTATTAADSTNG